MPYPGNLDLELLRLLNETKQLTNISSIEFRIWKAEVRELLSKAFGEASWQHDTFNRISWIVPPAYHNGSMSYDLNGNPMYSDTDTPISIMSSTFEMGKEEAIKLLEKISLMTSQSNTEEVNANSDKVDLGIKRVFISHGRSADWHEVQNYIEKDIGINTLELAQEPSKGGTIIEKLERYTPQCSYAVIVMSGDDTDSTGSSKVRENVMHEIGWFQAKYTRSRVCLLHELGVSIATNIGGIVYIGYPKNTIKATFAELRKEIEDTFSL